MFDQQVKYDPENQSNDNAGSPMGIAQVIIKPVECQHGAAEHESDGETLQFGLFVANHDSSHEKRMTVGGRLSLSPTKITMVIISV